MKTFLENSRYYLFWLFLCLITFFVVYNYNFDSKTQENIITKAIGESIQNQETPRNVQVFFKNVYIAENFGYFYGKNQYKVKPEKASKWYFVLETNHSLPLSSYVELDKLKITKLNIENNDYHKYLYSQNIYGYIKADPKSINCPVWCKINTKIQTFKTEKANYYLDLSCNLVKNQDFLEGIFGSENFWQNKQNCKQEVGYLLAITFADKRWLDDDLKESFKNLGIVHLIVLSGSHLGLLAEFIEKPLENHVAFKKRLFLEFILVTSLLVYVGISPPLFRAWVFWSLGFLARILGRKPMLELFWFYTVVICLCFFPVWYQSVSFGLSITASLAIIWVSKLEKALALIKPKNTPGSKTSFLKKLFYKNFKNKAGYLLFNKVLNTSKPVFQFKKLIPITKFIKTVFKELLKNIVILIFMLPLLDFSPKINLLSWLYGSLFGVIIQYQVSLVFLSIVPIIGGYFWFVANIVVFFQNKIPNWLLDYNFFLETEKASLENKIFSYFLFYISILCLNKIIVFTNLQKIKNKKTLM